VLAKQRFNLRERDVHALERQFVPSRRRRA
jgi:hypothetical protein